MEPSVSGERENGLDNAASGHADAGLNLVQ